MAVDLSQFHQVFIEESIEGLDIMENALMELDPGNIESETINAIFRAAHSIKGGGATFGFSAIAEFTHVLETLLDQIRCGSRGMSTDDVDLFLQSVDCMREMLSLLQDDQNVHTETSLRLKAEFEAILHNQARPNSEAEAKTESQQAAVEAPKVIGWAIDFTPGEDILKSGNDPMRIFSSLQDLGDLTVKATLNRVPELKLLDPEQLHVSWSLTLQTTASKEEVESQFEWVSDESQVIVTPLSAAAIGSSEGTAKGEKVVTFVPEPDILLSGNEPLKLLQALVEFDPEAQISAELSSVPTLKLLDGEQCYISWRIAMNAAITDEQILDVFEWVEDSAAITIQLMEEPTPLDSKELIAASDSISDEPVAVAPVAEAHTVHRAKEVSSPVAAKVQSGSPANNTTPKAGNAKKSTQSEASSIRVGIDKIDNLINMVGELVITQSMLGQLGTDFDLNKTPKLIEGLSQLEQNTRELQESVMRIRMLPISFAFSRFPRMVRDLGNQLGKKIHLEMLGEQTELDKTVMEKIGDPLVHLVRNAVDHGIEPALDRKREGKPETGKITLNAYHQGGNVVIEIVDDGKGLDRDVILKKAVEKGIIGESEGASLNDESVFDLIFQPGFSTAAQVSDISGRGVGMDVVKKNIQSLNGVVEIQSKKGEGSKIRIRLPLTLAILDGQLVRVGSNIYIFPLVSIVESMQCNNDLVNNIAGAHSVFRLRDDYVPIVRLNRVFGVGAQYEDLDQALMVVVESDGDKIGIVVDELLAQQQVVIKSLEQNYRRIEGVSGATILGDGTVALIVDIPGVVKLAGAEGIKHVMPPEVAAAARKRA